MGKYIKISNEIYPFKFHVFLGYGSIEEIKKVLKLRTKKGTNEARKYLNEIDLEGCAARVAEFKGNIFIMIKKFKGDPESYDTLHHEMIHAVNMAAEYIGIEFQKSSEEFYSYLIGYLTKKIYKEIIK